MSTAPDFSQYLVPKTPPPTAADSGGDDLSKYLVPKDSSAPSGQPPTAASTGTGQGASPPPPPSAFHRFEDSAVKSMGFDPDKIRKAGGDESTLSDIGNEWKETGSEAWSGLKGFGKRVLGDPTRAVTDPAQSIAGNLEHGASDIYHGKVAEGAGELLGGSSGLAAGLEAPEAAGDAAAAVRAPGRLIDRVRASAQESADDAQANRAARTLGASRPEQFEDVKAALPKLRGATGLESLKDRIAAAKQATWAPYNEGLANFGHEVAPRSGHQIADAIANSVNAADEQRNPLAVAKIQKMAEGYADKEFSLADLETMRRQSTADMATVEGKYPAQKGDIYTADPEWRAYKAEHDALSNVLDREMSARGIDASQIRKDYGPIKGVGRLAERMVPKEAQASPFMRRAGTVTGAAAGSAVGGALGHPVLGAGMGATLGERIANRIGKKSSPTDVNIRKAFKQ